METYWDTDKAGGLPGYLGPTYPFVHTAAYGIENVVRVDFVNGGLLLFDKPGLGGVAFAATILPLDVGLRLAIHNMIELHSDDWGV